MEDTGIDVQPDQPVRAIEIGAGGTARAVTTDVGSYDGDLVVLGLGTGPEVELARAAGLRIGETGAATTRAPSRSR